MSGVQLTRAKNSMVNTPMQIASITNLYYDAAVPPSPLSQLSAAQRTLAGMMPSQAAKPNER